MAKALMAMGYLPDITWFGNFLKHEHVLLEREENFVKSTFRNRCVIAGAGGKQILSIPVAGGRDHHQKYKDVKISYQSDWQHHHWQSILSSYGSAPFFEFYEDRFREFYNREFELLFDFNLELLRVLLSALKINRDLLFTSIYEKSNPGTVDMRNMYKPASKYLIQIPRYYQVFEEKNGFITNLSALDLLFHLGPQSADYLKAL